MRIRYDLEADVLSLVLRSNSPVDAIEEPGGGYRKRSWGVLCAGRSCFQWIDQKKEGSIRIPGS